MQANFAFSKAYLVDQAGSKAGFAGPHCFVDASFFDEEVPKWLSVVDMIRWETDGMSGRFYRINGFDNRAAGAMLHAGVRDAVQIAATLGVRY